MPRYQYETVQVESSFWTSAPKGLEDLLNTYAAEGWRLCQVIAPTQGGMFGYHVILEREVA
jgi:hypothetical protein